MQEQIEFVVLPELRIHADGRREVLGDSAALGVLLRWLQSRAGFTLRWVKPGRLYILDAGELVGDVQRCEQSDRFMVRTWAQRISQVLYEISEDDIPF